MLAYFPTEQLYYLRVHDIVPATITLPVLGKTVALNAKKLLQASSRFYLAYIFLEFFRLKERAGLLYTKQKALNRANADSVEANSEKAELKDSLKAHQLATAYNALRLPGALQWCVRFPQISVHLFSPSPRCPRWVKSTFLILSHPGSPWSSGSHSWAVFLQISSASLMTSCTRAFFYLLFCPLWARFPLRG